MCVVRRALCAGSFDGHRCWQAAQHAAEHLQEYLPNQTQRSDAGSALGAAFLCLGGSLARMQVRQPLYVQSIYRYHSHQHAEKAAMLQQPHDIHYL